MSRTCIFALDAADYAPHPLHCGERDWLESNCYIDVYLEVLHALGLEVPACLAFTLAQDFDDDQWTFFKPPLCDMDDLYGVHIQELTLWRPLVEHVEEQLAAGRLVVPEVDAFYLPDVASTDYKTAHVKTTIAIAQMDRKRRSLGYFHNTGYHSLEADDFDGIFRLGPRFESGPEDYLPPYCELVKLDRLVRRPRGELLELALEQARSHLRRRPARNPMLAYRDRLRADMEWLVTRDLATYHAYVFATVRQCGAGFEFAASFVRWLCDSGVDGLEDTAERFLQISHTAKMMVMKMARIARSKQPRDLSPHVDAMAADWQAGIDRMVERLQP